MTPSQKFLSKLTKESIREYIEHLNKKYKPKTAKRKLATLNYLLMQVLIECNPFD